jgi:hypothetical protein
MSSRCCRKIAAIVLESGEHINNTSMLLPYEQLYIQTLQHHKQRILEQTTGEHNSLYQLKGRKEEMDLLNHGMQYSTEKPLKTYWTNLLVETKRAIKLLDTKLQNPYQIMVAKRMKQSKTQTTTTKPYRRDNYII